MITYEHKRNAQPTVTCCKGKRCIGLSQYHFSSQRVAIAILFNYHLTMSFVNSENFIKLCMFINLSK